MTAPRLSRSLLTIALLLVAAHLGAQQKQVVPLPDDRGMDSYAIYSLLLNEQPFDALPPDQTARLAIAGTTVSIREMNPAVAPDSALQPPGDNANAFQEAVRDFRSRRFERVQLARRFALGQDYALLSDAQVADFRNARSGTSPGSDLQEQYAGYPGITFFTQVYFDARRTAALVYRNNWCASPCSNGQWFYLEKHGNTWVRRSGSETQP